MVVALDNVRKREHPSRIERSRGLADAIAKRGRLVKYEGKALVEPTHGAEGRQCRLDICRTRARWDKAQIGRTYAAYAQHILRGCGVNYRYRKAVPPEV